MSSISPRTRAVVTAGALLLAAAIPAGAQASTVSYDGDTLLYRAAPGERNSTGPGAGAFDPSRLYLSDHVPITLRTDRCTPYETWVECEMPARVVLDMGDGDDWVSFSFAVAGPVYEVYGGEGKDLLEGYAMSGPVGQLLDGGPGNDQIDGKEGADVVRGGAGDDLVDGGAGPDTVEGGEGNDLLRPDRFEDPAADLVDGGPGFDVVSDYSQPGNTFQPRLDISFDGRANDGRPDENDNLVGVEKLDAGVSGTFAGGPGDDDFFITSNLDQGSSTVTGGPGADRLTGHDHVEAIDGGPGDDRVEGGYGNDTLTGGPGRDTIFGDSTADTCNLLSCKVPFGNDVIDARDGELDTIDCGAGTDRIAADAIDVVARCEQVDVGRPGGGPTDPGNPGQAGDPERLTRKALRQGFVVVRDCPAECTVTARLARKGVVVARGRATASGRVAVRVELTRAGRKRLARLRRGNATLRVSVKQAATVTRTAAKVALRR